MNIKTVFHTIIRTATATSISGTDILSASNASAATQNPSLRKRRRLARYLATAATTTGLLAAGVVTANASVPDPWGGQVVTTVICDPATQSVTLLSQPGTAASADIYLYDWATGTYMGGVTNASATPAEGGGALYSYIHGAPGSYSVSYNLVWPEMGTYAGENGQAYFDSTGVQTNGCFLG